MNRKDILLNICLNEKNINLILKAVCKNIKLSERSLPKCASMIREVMKKNVAKIDVQNHEFEEYKKIIYYLNKLCVEKIIEIIAKKYPQLHINKKKYATEEKMRRDIDIYGRKGNPVCERPYTKNKKSLEKYEDTKYSSYDDEYLQPSNVLYSSPYEENNLLISVADRNAANNMDLDIEKRYQMMMNERKETDKIIRPPTPDFTLDGSNEKIKKMKMMRSMQNDSQKEIKTVVPDSYDDPYQAILGEGAPVCMSNTLPGGDNPNIDPNMNGMPVYPGYGQKNPDMSSNYTNSTDYANSDDYLSQILGGKDGRAKNPNFYQEPGTNPCQSYPSMNSYSGQSMNQPSKKFLDLQAEYEKKLAEREMMDHETGQPVKKATSNVYNQNMNMLSGNSYSYGNYI